MLTISLEQRTSEWVVMISDPSSLGGTVAACQDHLESTFRWSGQVNNTTFFFFPSPPPLSPSHFIFQRTVKHAIWRISPTFQKVIAKCFQQFKSARQQPCFNITLLEINDAPRKHGRCRSTRKPKLNVIASIKETALNRNTRGTINIEFANTSAEKKRLLSRAAFP